MNKNSLFSDHFQKTLWFLSARIMTIYLTNLSNDKLFLIHFIFSILHDFSCKNFFDTQNKLSPNRDRDLRRDPRRDEGREFSCFYLKNYFFSDKKTQFCEITIAIF